MTAAMVWTSRKVSDWTIGHWSGRFSIYENIATGRCVLSGGPPDPIGPIHAATLDDAKTALDAMP
jgi:hypothetical protein